MTPEEIGEKFEKDFGTRSDYFNHRLGLFMEMKAWIIDHVKQSHKLPVMRPASAGAVGGELLPAEGNGKGVGRKKF